MSNDIVSTDWLADHLGSPDIAIIDASWHLPTANRDAKKEFTAAHIPGAQFFDIDELSDTSSSLPHMLPSPEKFSSRMRRMGIGDGKRIIAYDTVGLFSAARAWWMFKVFGHDDVAVLDGGMKKWLAEGRPTEDGPALPRQERHFTARFKGSMVKDMKEVAAALKSGAAQVADARSGTRFRGEEVEPRPGVRAGHMPGASNVHYASLLNSDGTLRSPVEIKAAFAAAGIDLSKPVITSCGSGVTAAILSLGLTLTGARDHALYDGSWTEWGSDPDATVVTGS
jgi:thiosulfate/3-mercaptopyruvate sulfurtransferase